MPEHVRLEGSDEYRDFLEWKAKGERDFDTIDAAISHIQKKEY